MSEPTGCVHFEEAISARADGESLPLPAEVLDTHLARCGSCQAYAVQTDALGRRVRVRT
ncbi:MAG: zf-HC2 domain-containing protein, partial [Acidimicrobiales bacterium]